MDTKSEKGSCDRYVKTCFTGAVFIKPNIPFETEYRERNPAPIFRRRFVLKPFKSAKLYVCGLGYGYYRMNGQKVSQDLFTAPVSDYRKTLWYNVYDVTKLLCAGENIAAVICGNGFYNETVKSSWKHNTASWRDNPKFIMRLVVDGKTALVTDDSWKCSTAASPVVFNQLRSGEYYDSRLYNEKWDRVDYYDDEAWDCAVGDDRPPEGIFRECLCEPIRECAEYETKKIIKAGDGRYIFDIGQNISGYIRLKTCQKAGDTRTVRYAEQLDDDNTLQLNRMEKHYPESPFQTDRFICCGREFTWSPMFTYHGFRYIELTGIENPGFDTVTGIFVHQDVKAASAFECSDDFLNRLFRIGQMATLSNLFYMPTDCPTREKMGWANDAQASAEQMLINFDTVRLFRKWMTDITDSMRDDGCLPGIIPSPGWGYEPSVAGSQAYNGPVCDGVLFEVPYRIYMATGDREILTENLRHFIKYLRYISGRADPDDGMVGYGLYDWAPPDTTRPYKPAVPVKFINTVLIIKFYRIAVMAAELGDSRAEAVMLGNEVDKLVELFRKNFIARDGTSVIDEQTAVAMIIYHKLYDGLNYGLEPLKTQLKRLVEERDFHHNCGMVGLRHLYDALNTCGLQEYAYRIITAKGYPGYSLWLEGGATTLWETWQPGNSKNHHMYSDFMAWMMKTLVGINPVAEAPGYEKVVIAPAFIPELDFCKGHCDTVKGRISVEWEWISPAEGKPREKAHIRICMPDGVKGVFNGKALAAGIYETDI